MPLASIDVGSNTLRLLIGIVEGNKITRLRCEMVTTRLAAGLNSSRLLKAENMEKSISVLKEFSNLMSEHNASHLKAIGTSAMREAKNSEEFIGRVLSGTGIKIEVISGREEAELTAKGVLSDLPKTASSFIIDIGGGSTEWILCEDSSIIEMGTIPVGVVKLLESHIISDPPSKSDLLSINGYLGKILNRLKAKVGHLVSIDTVLIGTAGTITTLASIDLGIDAYSHEKIHRYNISLRRLYDISEKLISLSCSDRKNLKGLEPERADLIIPGILFTIKIMETFGFNSILVSDNGLLEGALLRLSEEVYKIV
ncbi:MAG: Ppx/GppA family phosphatase [Nitrospirae bacterium]|nr:Ppx/GppA family phosphatase [Nitrospirota bacterium]